MIRKIIDRINTSFDAYEKSMNEWHAEDPEGYYNHIAGVKQHGNTG